MPDALWDDDALRARPTRDETCMAAAQVFASRGTCSRRAVGVVIAFDGRILATGYNGAPKGLPHCEHVCDCGFPGKGGEFLVTKHLSNCSKYGDKAVCRHAVHAEANAIAFAARYGMTLEGATLYSTASPCLACAQLIINSGIVRVRCGESYHDPDGMRLLVQAGLQVS